MTAFKKPQPLKAALKMALYGPAGSGKTFTALLAAEGLASHTGKRIALVEYRGAFIDSGQKPIRLAHRLRLCCRTPRISCRAGCNDFIPRKNRMPARGGPAFSTCC
jgi:hypothetical protein